MTEAKKYLIGIGTNKAGTSSLFTYLGDHPAIHPSIRKQLNFFLSKDYLTKSKMSAWSGAYANAFPDSNKSSYHLDISPDYMYDPNAVNEILKVVPKEAIKILVILRDPIDRLESWFKYAKQNDWLESDSSFSDFIHLQNKEEKSHFVHESKEQGCYTKYLQVYFDNFDKEQIKVIFLEDLKNDPSLVLQNLMDWLKLDPQFYASYSFEIKNKSHEVKNKFLQNYYLKLHRWTVAKTINNRYLYKLISPIGKFMTKSINSVNTKDPKSSISDEEARLIQYYEDEVKGLKKILGRKIPWKRFEHV